MVRSCSLLVLIVLTFGCGGGGRSTPTTPATPPPVAATPTPAPTPPPTAGPQLPAACRAFSDGGGAAQCSQGTSENFNRVRDAVERAKGATAVDPHSGEIYDVVGRENHIMGVSAYLQTIVNDLDSAGICAVYDGEELYVRNSGNFNEYYDIITGGGDAWTNYVSTCAPARPFPMPRQAPVRDPDCRLPPSYFTFCVREDRAYEGDVHAVLDEMIAADRARATPLWFDFRDLLSGTTGGYRVINEDAYMSEVVARMKQRGFCALRDSDEINLKRGTNRFSENYDILRSDLFSLRNYIATCRDAGF